MNRNRNLIISLVMGVSLLLSAASAQTVLTIAHGMTGGSDRTAFDAMVAAYESMHPDVQIKQVVQDDDLYEDAGLITLLKSNDPPDIFFQFGGERVRSDAEEGFAHDLTDVLNQDGWKDTFIDAAWSPSAGTMVGDRVYMIPSTLDVTTVIWYNTDIFEQYGLTEPTTWQGLLDLTKTLADAGETPFIFGNQELWPLGNWAGHITAQVVSPEAFDAAFSLREPFDQPEFVQAFEQLQQLADLHAFNQDMASLGADPAMDAFFQGFAVMHPIGSWLVSTALESAPADFHYDAFNTPPAAGASGSPDSIIGLSTGWEINANTDSFDEAVSFLRFFSDLQNQVAWAEAGSFSPVVGAMEAADLDPHTQKLAELFEQAASIVPPPDTGYPQAVADIFYQGAAYVAGGLKTPEDALKWVDEQVAPLKN